MPEIMDSVTVDGTVTATRFIGPLTGTATRASADASGNGISATYATKTAVAAKQDALVSGTNIKTVNGTSLLGSGDITIGGLSGTVGTDTKPIKIVNGQAVAVTHDLITIDTDQNITGKKTIYSTNTAELPIQTGITTAGDIGGIGYYDGNGEKIIKTWGTTTGKYTIELLAGSQKSAEVINQRSFNVSNTNDIVTIGTHLQAMGWIKQTSDNLGRLATCNEVMLRGTFTSAGRTCEVSTIHPGNASSGINLAISYLNSYYGVVYIHPQAIYTVASSGNWNAFEIYFR